MQNSTTLRRHAALVDNMARALGLDLEETVLRGKMPPGELGDAIMRCTGCAAPEACDHWLSEHAEAARPPEYCRNTELFDFLKAER